MIQFKAILQALQAGEVEFIVVGGLAAIAHGTARVTYDVDVVYRRTPENMARLATALASYSPYLRGAPPGLPFRFDAATIKRGLNFTLITQLGDLDLLGEMTGAGSYDDVLPQSVELTVAGQKCLCVGLDQLILAKRAAGRPKDWEAISELEALREEKLNNP